MKKFKFCLTNLNTKVYQLYLKQNTNQNLFAYVRFYSTKLFVSELWKQSDTQKCIKEMQDWRRERKCNQKLSRCKFIHKASKFRTCGSGLWTLISLHLVFQVTNKLKKGSWTSYLLFFRDFSSRSSRQYTLIPVYTPRKRPVPLKCRLQFLLNLLPSG